MADLEKAYTLENFIDAELDDDIIDYNLSIIHAGKDVQVVETNVIFDYIEDLKASALKLKLSNDEYNKYKYRPDLLSFDLYKTIDYEFILLALNSISDPSEFDTRTCYILDPDEIGDLLSEIYNSEIEYINFNRSAELGNEE